MIYDIFKGIAGEETVSGCFIRNGMKFLRKFVRGTETKATVRKNVGIKKSDSSVVAHWYERVKYQVITSCPGNENHEKSDEEHGYAGKTFLSYLFYGYKDYEKWQREQNCWFGQY